MWHSHMKTADVHRKFTENVILTLLLGNCEESDASQAHGGFSRCFVKRNLYLDMKDISEVLYMDASQEMCFLLHLSIPFMAGCKKKCHM